MNVVALKIERTPYTYILQWTEHGKFYIGARWGKGCHPDDLWTDYFTSSQYVKDFVKENGKPDLIWADKEFTDPNQAMRREKWLIRNFDAVKDPRYLNKSIGGVFDFHDPEIRRRLKEANKGRKMPPEWIAWVTEFHRTRKRSPETSARISKALTGKTLSPEHRAKCKYGRLGKPGWNKGIPWSPEMREKLAAARTGISHSDATKKRMSEMRTGRKFAIVTCPHCRKEGGESGMKAQHFDHCRKKVAA